MQYMLMFYGNEAAEQSLTEAQRTERTGAYKAYSEALAKAGVMVGGGRLKPIATATTVRVANGKTEVLNGPYADTKEQLGGYYLIDVANSDAALSWAARNPGASEGTIEVRPIWAM